MGVNTDLRTLLLRLQERARYSKHHRKDMFFQIDADRNGFITVQELRTYLSTTCPQPLSDEEAIALIRVMDRDGDGRIDFDEWTRWLHSEPAEWDMGGEEDGAKGAAGKPDEWYLTRRDTNVRVGAPARRPPPPRPPLTPRAMRPATLHPRVAIQDEHTRAQRVMRALARTFTHTRSQLRSIFHMHDPEHRGKVDRQGFKNTINHAKCVAAARVSPRPRALLTLTRALASPARSTTSS